MPTGRPASWGHHQLPLLSVISSQSVRNKPLLHLYGTPSVAAISNRRLPRPPVKRPGSYAAPSPTHMCAGSPRGVITVRIPPRGQETVPRHCVRVHIDRPIRDLSLRPQARHIKKEKLEARTELQFTCLPSWPG
ncbi:hypothetical protein NDU88_010197 [Pleurodeles waltl]|uniref:Uncharacterized protein n=1 Tax=Pleurodeles waltl TaxID=8319 RepID=A0AAV7QV79_PLEWA|nr:hypothetical protein NDU88_010197 [Pleurodeles waltl]